MVHTTKLYTKKEKKTKLIHILFIKIELFKKYTLIENKLILKIEIILLYDCISKPSHF